VGAFGGGDLDDCADRVPLAGQHCASSATACLKRSIQVKTVTEENLPCA
jgi:hypothetical protein